jgi:hypothetical protein
VVIVCIEQCGCNDRAEVILIFTVLYGRTLARCLVPSSAIWLLERLSIVIICLEHKYKIRNGQKTLGVPCYFV